MAIKRNPREVYVGIARHKKDGEAPTLNDALKSAAGKAIDAGVIKKGSTQTVWFDIAFIAVELGNQHPRTYQVGVTPQLPPGT